MFDSAALLPYSHSDDGQLRCIAGFEGAALMRVTS
jgi:hypothetical protein